MPRTCLACNSPNREAIDKALANGTSLRDIEGQWDISRSALDRHKSHVATAIVKAQAQREENSGNSTLEEMQRVQRKAWELLAKAEKKGDNRGAIVALREVRECVESLGEMLNRAADWRRPGSFRVVVEHIGTVVDGKGKPTDRKELPRMPIPADQQPCIEMVPDTPEAVPRIEQTASNDAQAATPTASDATPATKSTEGLVGMSFAITGRRKKPWLLRGGD